MDTKGHMLLSSTCTTGKIWGHKSYDTGKAVRYVRYKKLKKPSLKTNISTRGTTNEICKHGFNWRIPPPLSKGNRYALTAVCMLTGYTFCIPIKNKSAEEIVTAWRNHIAFPFGVCRKLLMDNGTEFKNDLFSKVTEQLGVERKIYSPLYRPQSNGKIEGFHKFLKSCLAKHFRGTRNGTMLCDLQQHHTTGYQTNTQRNHLSLWCLAGMLCQTCHNSPNPKSGTWVKRI